METRKTCSKCGATKPLDQFRRRASMRDGRDAQCKACRAAHEASPAYLAGMSKRRRSRYAADPGYRAKRVGTGRPKKPATQAAYEASYRKAQPDKYRARRSVKRAVQQGRMPAASTLLCANCGRQAAQYHHHKGYAREHWRDVVPLCFTCHGVEGRKPLN